MFLANILGLAEKKKKHFSCMIFLTRKNMVQQFLLIHFDEPLSECLPSFDIQFNKELYMFYYCSSIVYDEEHLKVVPSFKNWHNL